MAGSWRVATMLDDKSQPMWKDSPGTDRGNIHLNAVMYELERSARLSPNLGNCGERRVGIRRGNALSWEPHAREHGAAAHLDALTADDLLRVAKKYFVDARSTTLIADPTEGGRSRSTGIPPRRRLSQPSTQPVAAKVVPFPAEFAHLSGFRATFEKGVEKGINGTLIVMTDHRLPIVSWSADVHGGAPVSRATRPGWGDGCRDGPQGAEGDDAE